MPFFSRQLQSHIVQALHYSHIARNLHFNMSWTQRQDDEVEALGYIIDDGAFTTSPRSTVLPLKLHIKVSLSVIIE
jgi:hypothetical protein